MESAAERCVSTLVDLIQTKVTYVVQEAVVVIKDIFRKYPNQYESIISTLCENLDSLDEPEARYAPLIIRMRIIVHIPTLYYVHVHCTCTSTVLT